MASTAILSQPICGMHTKTLTLTIHLYICIFLTLQMVNLYRDPTGEKVFESANPSKLAQPKTTKEHHSMAMGLSELTDEEKVELLDSRVKVLEKRVEEKNQRINQLETFMNT